MPPCLVAVLYFTGFLSGGHAQTAAASSPPKSLVQKAASGNVKAQCALGRIYANGLGVRQDYAEALRWYRAAAEKGYAEAEDKLGFLYDFGEGVPEDQALATEWYRKSALQGNPDAQFNLASLYDTGQGVPQNQSEAARWYRMAADRGDAEYFGNGFRCVRPPS